MSRDAKAASAADALAHRLLDAQVEFVVGQLTGERLAANIARDVDDVLTAAKTVTVADVVDADAVKAVGRKLLDQVGGSAVVHDLALALSDAIYDLSASEKYDLGDVVDREPVEALIAKVIGMEKLHARVMDRLAESPLVATVAAKFVATIVNDFVQQNRQVAERLPGAKSLFSLGSSVGSRVMRAPIIGDAADKGAQLAIRRTNSALREVIRHAPLQGAAMEVWDLHANEPISHLRKYLSRTELRELVQLVYEILISARDTEFAGALLDECIDVFFEQYGTRDVASLLPELGLDRDDLVEDLCRLAPPLLEAARADGTLERLVRSRLEPFFTAASTLALLAGDVPPTKN